VNRRHLDPPIISIHSGDAITQSMDTSVY
jgi:hypothetical protein